ASWRFPESDLVEEFYGIPGDGRPFTRGHRNQPSGRRLRRGVSISVATFGRYLDGAGRRFRVMSLDEVSAPTSPPGCPPPDRVRTMRCLPPAVLCSLVVLGGPAVVTAAEPGKVDFQRDVLPLLQERCFKCHDARKRTASYRIDVRSSALRGGESGKLAIVPG